MVAGLMGVANVTYRLVPDTAFVEQVCLTVLTSHKHSQDQLFVS